MSELLPQRDNRVDPGPAATRRIPSPTIIRRMSDERVPLPDQRPRCPHCGGLARPAVVWFGESLDAADVRAASEATNCDVFLTVGTSAIVYPAAGFMHAAKAVGAFTADINLEPTPASSIVDVAIRGPAADVLDQIHSWICG